MTETSLIDAPVKVRSRLPACYHCGAPCRNGELTLDRRNFCCTGCLAVYRLLSEQGLSPYYRLDSLHPGSRPRRGATRDRFAILDDDAVAGRLLEFAGERQNQVTWSIPAMHCSACVWLLERLNSLEAGIVRSRVDFPRRRLTITFEPEHISLRRLAELLAGIGYEPTINLENLDELPAPRANRRLYYQLGVAGFAWGNIMLYSFPEYLTLGNDLAPAFRQLFRYLSLALALPVLLYSSLDFFRSAWTGLRQKMLNIDVPISLGIAVMFGRSGMEIISGSGAGYLDSFSGLVFFLLIGRLFQQKSYAALSFDSDYRSYFPLSVTVLDSGRERAVPLPELKTGDRLLVRNGELVPTDAVLVEGAGRFDLSFITGESEPVVKAPGDLVPAGGRRIGAAVELKVAREPSLSRLPLLWSSDVFSQPQQTRIASAVNTVSRYFTTGVLAIATAAGAFWLWRDPSVAAGALTAVLIVACPCALALSVPFALGTAQRILGRRHFFLKNPETVESLAKVDTIVFDKTGTLTQTGEPAVDFIGPPLTSGESALVRALARQSSHPLSRRLDSALEGRDNLAVTDFQEQPGQGIAGVVNGRSVRLGSPRWTGATGHGQGAIDGHSTVHVSLDRAYRGCLVVANHFRPGMVEVVSVLSRDHELVVLSGDSDRDRPAWRKIFGDRARLLFNQSPADKAAYIRALQAKGRRVLMIGDGLNDAGALKAADVGVAVAEDINTFSPACDGILGADSFHRLSAMLRLSRETVGVVLASFALSIVYNLVGLAFAVSGQLTPLVAAVLMPVSSVTVVAFTTLTTRWRAAAVSAGSYK
ncbi:MAG: heavy metal translocating P-type ATPase metal-binding domain-containing protein [Candidatus Neomarinimicrobiota bacterium]